jgi:hypothetical protein
MLLSWLGQRESCLNWISNGKEMKVSKPRMLVYSTPFVLLVSVNVSPIITNRQGLIKLVDDSLLRCWCGALDRNWKIIEDGPHMMVIIRG